MYKSTFPSVGCYTAAFLEKGPIERLNWTLVEGVTLKVERAPARYPRQIRHRSEFFICHVSRNGEHMCK